MTPEEAETLLDATIEAMKDQRPASAYVHGNKPTAEINRLAAELAAARGREAPLRQGFRELLERNLSAATAEWDAIGRDPRGTWARDVRAAQAELDEFLSAPPAGEGSARVEGVDDA